MAETPFSSEPGTPSPAAAPGDAGQGMLAVPAYEPAPQPDPGVNPYAAPVEPQPFAQPAPQPEPAPFAQPAMPEQPPAAAPPFQSPAPEATPSWAAEPPPPAAPQQPFASEPSPPETAASPEPPAPPFQPPVPEAIPSWAAELPPPVAPQQPFASEPSTPEAPATLEPPAEPAGVAETLVVPPLEQPGGEGGEWELLLERLSGWWNSGELGRQWQQIRGPLKGVAILLVVLVSLRVYATLVTTIDAIPLVSGLLELAGLITVLQFSTTRLLRSSDRQQVLDQLRNRWLDFRGRD